MSTEQSIQDRILVNKNNVYSKSNHDIKLIKKCKSTKRTQSSNKLKGKLCGAKHIAICAETRENFRKGLLLNYKRRDPFYMLDGIVVEEQEIDSVNTNSGVLFEDDLKYLQ